MIDKDTLMNHENTMSNMPTTTAMNTTTTATTTTETSRVQIAPSILGASAFVLAALTIIQAGRTSSPAYAESANSGQMGYSVATVRSGFGPDDRPYELVFVIDSRGEALFIYYIENITAQRMQLRQVISLPALFRQARG